MVNKDHVAGLMREALTRKGLEVTPENIRRIAKTILDDQKLLVKDFEVSVVEAVDKMTFEHEHTWIHYIGLKDSYQFCSICNMKRDQYAE